MTFIPEIRISDYTYNLPEEKIAVYPLSERDQSRLLVWRKGRISETLFSHAGKEVPEDTLLVFNNTRVIHARLIFHTSSGARIEVFCLEPHDPSDYNLSFQSTTSVEWKCMVGNARKWKGGILTMEIPADRERVNLKAEMTGRHGNAFLIRFTWNGNIPFSTLIETAGKMPIPPYLNRDAEAIDDDRYQTTYARIHGSVAAPTAGLHFTGKLLRNLAEHGIHTAELTLHVGAGTFQPVKSERIADHHMHTETVSISKSFLGKLLHHQGKIIAVGTTSVRSLESLYWLGKAMSESTESHPMETLGPFPAENNHYLPEETTSFPPATNSDNLRWHVSQWQPYTGNPDLPAAKALSNLMAWMEKHHTDQISFTTSIIIVPGYHFRIINGMFTNFHQPNSTLLLLVAAFLGHDWKKVYDYALHSGFRFLSYGDSNLYLKL